ncbi:MAG: hypothetical protein IPN54_04675 [Bacteroidetes bacterium]|nr:hypothetical protein [Bacteroidota bacterium]
MFEPLGGTQAQLKYILLSGPLFNAPAVNGGPGVCQINVFVAKILGLQVSYCQSLLFICNKELTYKYRPDVENSLDQ